MLMNLKVTFTLTLIPFLIGAQQLKEIDTEDDLESAAGWSNFCESGYQDDVRDFGCGSLIDPVQIDIPEDELSGEVGFWTGCRTECYLNYTVQSTDITINLRVYFKGNAKLTVLKDDVSETFTGENWENAVFDVFSVKTVEIILELAHHTKFVVLERIGIMYESATTTTTPAATTTTITRTSTTTTRPPTTASTGSTTTRKALPTLTYEVKSDMDNDPDWDDQCTDGYQSDVQNFDCPSSGKVNLTSTGNREGFWTECGFPCGLVYGVPAGYTHFIVEVYQSNRWMQICLDDEVDCRFFVSDGWQSYVVDISNVKKVHLHLYHSSSNQFVVLTKVVVSTELITTTTSVTTPSTTRDPISIEPTSRDPVTFSIEPTSRDPITATVEPTSRDPISIPPTSRDPITISIEPTSRDPISIPPTTRDPVTFSIEPTSRDPVTFTIEPTSKSLIDFT